MLNGKIMHVMKWVTKTANRDGKNLRHLKSQKINLFQSFLYLWAFNLVFMCPTFCQLKTTCLLLLKQKLYALDAFFIEKLKLSENDPTGDLGDMSDTLTSIQGAGTAVSENDDAPLSHFQFETEHLETRQRKRNKPAYLSDYVLFEH